MTLPQLGRQRLDIDPRYRYIAMHYVAFPQGIAI